MVQEAEADAASKAIVKAAFEKALLQVRLSVL